MQSIPVPPSNDYAEGVHGLDWPAFFRLRNGIAFTWYRRFRMLIPLEEFQSAGNETLVRAAHTFDPTRPPPFDVYLRKALRHAMVNVPRDEWRGWLTYTYSEERDTRGRRKLLERAYHAPALDLFPADEIDDDHNEAPHLTPPALHTHVNYEQMVYIAEGLRWLNAHVHGQRRAYVEQTLHGTGPQEIAAQYRVTLSTIQNALKRTAQRVQQWSSEGMTA